MEGAELKLFIDMIYVIAPFSYFLTPFFRTLILKGNANNGRNPLSSPYLGLMTPFPVIAFINEKARSCIKENAIIAINQTTIGVIIPPKISLFYFLFCILLFQLQHPLTNLIFLVTLRF